MSFITNQAHNASKRIDNLKRKLYAAESGEGSVGIPAESWATAVIKLAIIFLIGIVIIQGVVTNSGVNNSSAPFYSLLISVKNNITSGYSLASLTLLVLGAVSVIHYLGFV